MADTVAGHIRLVRIIDKFTDTTGVWVAWLNLPLVLAVAYEVIARYAFNTPTICCSVNRDRFMRASFTYHRARKLYFQPVYISGELTS